MILGISGKAGSGKDTVADYLVKNKYFTKVALADPIKRICGDVFNFSNEQLYGPSEMRSKPDERYPNVTVRKAAQLLGTEWARNLHEDIWVDYLLRTIKKFQSNPNYKYSQEKGVYKDELGFDMLMRNENVVVPDVRFSNEIKILKDQAYLIRIVRPSAGLVGESGQHASEMEQDSIPDSDFDDIIENNGTLDELFYKVDVIIGKYKFFDTY